MKEKEIGSAKEIEEWVLHVRGKPLEEAELIEYLISKGYERPKISKLLELSSAHLTKRLSLLGLSSELREKIKRGEIRASVGYVLSQLPEEERKRFEKAKRVTLEDAEGRKRQLIKSKKLEGLLNERIETGNCKHEFVCIHCGMEMKEHG